MIEINTDNLTKSRVKGAKDKKKRKTTIQGKSVDQRRKEMKARMKSDNTAQDIWDYRMGTDEDRARIDAEEKKKKND